MGRPRAHDRQAIVSAICAAVSGGQLVKDACAEHGIDRATLHRWTEEKTPEGEAYRKAYARAREDQAHALSEQAIAIAHGTDALTLEREAAVEAEATLLEQLADPQRHQKIRALQAGVINRDRLRVDTLKWMTSKIAPRVFGERQQVEHNGAVTLKLEYTETDE